MGPFSYYCNTFVPDNQHHPIPRRIVCDNTVGPLVFEAVEKETRRLGGSAMMTEGLACSGPTLQNYSECTAVMDDLDGHLFSWTDYGDSQGQAWLPSDPQQTVWSRTYARAIAGLPKTMRFDQATANFHFCFVPDVTVVEPTEIFASETRHYPGGAVVKTTANIAAKRKPGSRDMWLVTPTGTTDDLACVTIRRRSETAVP